MNLEIGIGMAFVAMLCWGIGDFLIQKSTRKLGDWETLFLITIFGVLILLPFSYKGILQIFLDTRSLIVMSICSIAMLIAAISEFEALRKGKIAVIEPMWAIEVPVAGLLAYFILGDSINTLQFIIIVLLLLGLFLISIREKISISKAFLEKGVILAIFGTVFMGVADFFLGWGSRINDPLSVNLFINLFLAVISGAYLMINGRFLNTFKDFWMNKKTVLPMMITDNVAWIAFASVMTIVPISIAASLSESSIVIAVILGIAINRERLKSHQKIGLIIAILSAIILASIVGN